MALSSAEREYWEKAEARGLRIFNSAFENVDRTQQVSLLYTTALRHLYIRVGLGEPEAAIREALYLASKAIETCFLFATGKASEARFHPPGGEALTVTKTDDFNPAHYTQDVDYIHAIYLAMLTGREGLNRLAEVEIEALTFSENHSNAYSNHYANFLRSVVNKDGQSGDWLTKAFKATFPDQITVGIPKFIEHNDVEQLKVWIALLGGDAQEFNEALQTAVEKHETYWKLEKAPIRGGMIPKKDPQGLFSLPLTAICKLAHQSGMAIQVTSDYLPELLIYGK